MSSLKTNMIDHLEWFELIFYKGSKIKLNQYLDSGKLHFKNEVCENVSVDKLSKIYVKWKNGYYYLDIKIYTAIYSGYKEYVRSLVNEESIEKYFNKEISQRLNANSLIEYLQNDENIYKYSSDLYLASFNYNQHLELTSLDYENLNNEYEVAVNTIVDGMMNDRTAGVHILQLLEDKIGHVSPEISFTNLNADSASIQHLKFIWLQQLKIQKLNSLQNGGIAKKINFEPIKIKGNINQVTAVFEKLLTDNVIESSKENIKKIILEVFRDNKGNGLSKHTLDTYFNNSKPFAKSKKQ